MFCKQCGKELNDGAKFCKFCGTAQDAGNEPAAAGSQAQAAAEPQAEAETERIPQAPAEEKTRKRGKNKGGIIAALVAVLLAAAVGVGAVLYFTGDSYHIKKNLKLAEECFAEGEHKEALSYYKAALKLDPSLVEAYLGSADIYIEESRYQDAVDILEKGVDKSRGRKKETLKEKLRDTYGLWVADLISGEDYDGARAVLDDATVLDAAALSEERQRVDQAESGISAGTEGTAGAEGTAGTEGIAGAAGIAGIEDSSLTGENSGAGAAADSSGASGTESAPMPETVPESSGSAPSEPEQPQFILPESDSRYLAMEELAGLTAEECRIARNELFARHGRMFKDEELQAYFDSCDWYSGWVLPADFDESVFNEYEVANRDLIIKYEKEQGYR